MAGAAADWRRCCGLGASQDDNDARRGSQLAPPLRGAASQDDNQARRATYTAPPAGPAVTEARRGSRRRPTTK